MSLIGMKGAAGRILKKKAQGMRGKSQKEKLLKAISYFTSQKNRQLS